jgi:glycosyltransferase involved in cell wall biosynthesis
MGLDLSAGQEYSEIMAVTNTHLISIIMSVRNGADTIKGTIESVIAQTHQNWELLIRDNCSTDNTADIIRSFNEPRINLIVNKHDKGVHYNFLLHQEAVKGEFIKSIDDDSYLYPECLERQLEILLEHPDIAMVTCDTEYHTPIGKRISARIPFKNDVVTRDDYIKFTLKTARGSVQEGNQILTRTEYSKFSLSKEMSIGFAPGLLNAYSVYFYYTAGILTKGNMYVIRETLSAGIIETNSYSLKLNQAKLMPTWIKMLQIEGYKINPFLYIWARVMIIARSAARRLAFWLLGR